MFTHAAMHAFSASLLDPDPETDVLVTEHSAVEECYNWKVFPVCQRHRHSCCFGGAHAKVYRQDRTFPWHKTPLLKHGLLRAGDNIGNLVEVPNRTAMGYANIGMAPEI